MGTSEQYELRGTRRVGYKCHSGIPDEEGIIGVSSVDAMPIRVRGNRVFSTSHADVAAGKQIMTSIVDMTGTKE